MHLWQRKGGEGWVNMTFHEKSICTILFLNYVHVLFLIKVLRCTNEKEMNSKLEINFLFRRH